MVAEEDQLSGDERAIERAVFAALCPFLTARMHIAIRALPWPINHPDTTCTALVALQGLIISRVRTIRQGLDRGLDVTADLDLLVHLARSWSTHPNYPTAALAAYTARRASGPTGG